MTGILFSVEFRMQYHARQCRSQSRGLSASSGLSYFAVFIALLLHISACLAQDQSQPLSPDESTAVFTPQYDVSLDKGKYGSYPTKKFYSSEFEVPKLNFLKWSPECATRNDFYFITPKGWKVDKPGPMILDHTGELVWAQRFDNEFGGQAYDLMVQEYLGEKFLTFWLGDDRIRGHGAGQFHMVCLNGDRKTASQDQKLCCISCLQHPTSIQQLTYSR